MAKFMDSAATAFNALGSEASTSAPAGAAPPASDLRDRSIGDILAELRSLSAEQVERVLQLQRERGVRFGEAAVALGLATRDDVLYALAQQFHYPYSPDEQRKVSPELVVLRESFSVRAEAFRALRSQIMMRLYASAERPALAVISPDSGDGKTYTAANLAVSLAQLGGGRTLLVDADLRNPRQHEVFGLPNRSGLSGILSGRSDGQFIQQVTGVPGLFVLPVGTIPPNPLELVERPAFGLLMKELVSKFDHVVVDTPAAVRGADASVIASRCGAVLLVARRNAGRVSWLQELVGSFAGSQVSIAGVVLNEF
jgi:chain length determinant protein tyrosine kinase EpsG